MDLGGGGPAPPAAAAGGSAPITDLLGGGLDQLLGGGGGGPVAPAVADPISGSLILIGLLNLNRTENFLEHYSRAYRTNCLYLSNNIF